MAAALLPLNRHLVHVSSWDHAQSRAWDVVDLHPLNQQVDVFFPTGTPSSVGPLSREGSFFYSMTVSPVALIHEVLRQPDLRYYALLKNSPVDGSNTLAIFPSGQLVLCLDHETYIQFGLAGEKMATISGESVHGRQYRVVIELYGKAMQDAMSSYRTRVLGCLAKFQPVDVLVCALNDRGSYQTIAFDGANGELEDGTPQRKRIEVNSDVHSFPEVALPTGLDRLGARPATADEWTATRAAIGDVYEWLGLVACRMPVPVQDDYLSSYVCPLDAVASTNSCAVSVRWRGLIPDSHVRKAVEYAKKQVADGVVPFAAVTVWGFPDTPASWWQKGVRRDHGFQFEGANGYTILCLPSNAYVLVQSLGAADATV
ncbi:hypothetical protein ACHHYP_06024 [Achlya hypogyna]|uniref:Uncharacterized protein n=1 Tax=Achlya hypogyna TaxID=1202772 RepID=A0A1V9YW19_ACHHY|nr:hypothetical protein ACHHYP_06024 [Achlya hypogyna]